MKIYHSNLRTTLWFLLLIIAQVARFSVGFTVPYNQAPKMFSVLASMTSRHCQRVSFHPIATMRSYSGSTCLQMAKKTNSASNDKLFRADRVLANRGMGSRSECFDLLKQRRVFQLIDGDKMERVKGPSEKLSMNVSSIVLHLNYM